MEAKQEFDQASRLVKTELARFEQERVEDFRDSLQAFLSGMIDRQKEVRNPLAPLLGPVVDAYYFLLHKLIATWESYQQALLKKVSSPTSQPPPPTQADVTSVNGSGTSSEDSG